MFGKIFFYTSVLLILFSFENVHSSIKNAEFLYSKGRGNAKDFTRIARNLVKEYRSNIKTMQKKHIKEAVLLANRLINNNLIG